MATLEEIMAGLFGSTEAGSAQGLGPAADTDPRRRRAGFGSGYDGISGGQVTLSSLLPHLQGLRTWDYSGPNLRGLADLLPGMLQGPALSHAERQTGPNFTLPPGLQDREELPPGIDNRLQVGGANVAPGNVETGRAIFQPPGLAQVPHTQGWRNVAPGFSAAASLGYGTPEFEGRLHGLGSLLGPAKDGIQPGAGPGVRGGQTSGGGSGAPKSTAGATASAGGGGEGGAPISAPGGGGGPVRAAAAGGGGGGSKSKQPSTKQIGAKKSGGSTGGGGDAGGKKGGPTQKQIVAKKGGSSPGPAPQPAPPAPKPVSNAGNPVAAKKGSPNPAPAPVSTPAPKPVPNASPVVAKKGSPTGSTKPKTTVAPGIKKSK